MKKLLALVGSATIITGASSALIACSTITQGGSGGNTPTPHPQPKSKTTPSQIKVSEKDLSPTTNIAAAQLIANKIINSNIAINSLPSLNVADATTVAALKIALKTANPLLTGSDLTTITFIGAPLKNNISNKVTVSILANGGKASVNIFVKFTKDATSCYQIIEKIKNGNITIPAGTDPYTHNSGTEAQIKAELLANNSELTVNDVQYLTFIPKSLWKNHSLFLLITATMHHLIFTKTIWVSLPYSEADKLANKIKDTHLYLTNLSSPDTTNTDTLQNLKQNLLIHNPDLTATDLNDITVAKTTLKVNQKTAVKLTIQLKGLAVTKTIYCYNVQDSSTALGIFFKIHWPFLYLPMDINPDTTNAQTSATIHKILQENNPLLTSDDLQDITLAPQTLSYGHWHGIELDISVNNQGETSSFYGMIFTIGFESRAQSIIDKVKNTNITIGPQKNLNTADSQTLLHVLLAVQKANPSLNILDVMTLSLSPATLVVGKATPVALTSKTSNHSKSITLNITVSKS